ncbi:4-hydroxy-tetrahydrodipicolinate synthase [Ottowia sp.]|uniref:4-hydroxy-tetrahydrodipicolinate synthase n=1 Tax=Ottowia sp. TaxID=1898956 RepID=UPI003A887935
MSAPSLIDLNPFHGVWAPIITPFSDDDQVDHTALGRLAARLATSGLAGLVVCGSTGEAAALSPEEQLACLHTVAQHAPELPVIMGVSGYHLGKMQGWLAELGRSGPPLAGVLLPAPCYVRPSQAGLAAWFTQLADVSPAPLVLYDIPYRTGTVIDTSTLLALAAHPNISAIKDCGGDGTKMQALLRDGRLAVLAGEDVQMLSTLALGGTGAIAACAQVHPERFVTVARAAARSDLDSARQGWHALAPLVQALFAEPNPGPLKALLASEGWCQDRLRLPMTSASAATRAHVIALSRTLGPML